MAWSSAMSRRCLCEGCQCKAETGPEQAYLRQGGLLSPSSFALAALLLVSAAEADEAEVDAEGAEDEDESAVCRSQSRTMSSSLLIEASK